MNKRLASLLAAALLLPGCSWMTALNPWADDVPAAEETEVAVPQSVNRYLWQALCKNVKDAVATQRFAQRRDCQ